MSRQLRRQRCLRKLGQCIICSKSAAKKKQSTPKRPVYASRCPSCLEIQRARYYKNKSKRRQRVKRGHRRTV
jgi:hypothetical protein